MIICPHCQHREGQVKIGHNASGSQRYRCKNCRRKYTPQPRDHGYSATVRQEALKLYVDGLNFRRIARILQISRQSVANWANAYANQLPDKPPLPTDQLDVNELDELFTFIGDKKTKSTS